MKDNCVHNMYVASKQGDSSRALTNSGVLTKINPSFIIVINATPTNNDFDPMFHNLQKPLDLLKAKNLKQICSVTSSITNKIHAVLSIDKQYTIFHFN